MDPFTMALVMGGTGLLSSQMNKSAQQDANRANAQAAAAQTQFSPYTKFKPGTYQAQPLENPIAGPMSGAVAGLNLSQSYNKAVNDQSMLQNGLSNNQMNSYNASLGNQLTSPWAMSYDSYNRTGNA